MLSPALSSLRQPALRYRLNTLSRRFTFHWAFTGGSFHVSVGLPFGTAGSFAALMYLSLHLLDNRPVLQVNSMISGEGAMESYPTALQASAILTLGGTKKCHHRRPLPGTIIKAVSVAQKDTRLQTQDSFPKGLPIRGIKAFR